MCSLNTGVSALVKLNITTYYNLCYERKEQRALRGEGYLLQTGGSERPLRGDRQMNMGRRKDGSNPRARFCNGEPRGS